MPEGVKSVKVVKAAKAAKAAKQWLRRHHEFAGALCGVALYWVVKAISKLIFSVLAG